MIHSDILDHIKFRPVERGDLNIVVDTFIRTLREQELLLGFASDGQRFRNLDHMLMALSHPGQAVVASLSKTPEALVGWAVKDETSLLFCYVKKDFRRWGIGSAAVAQLIDTAPVEVVYWTRAARKIHANKFPITWDWQRFHKIQGKVIGNS